MTPEQHNKYLGWSHIGYATIFLLFTLLIMGFFGLAMIGAMLGGPSAGATEVFMLLFVWLFIAVIYGAMIIPSFIAGYGLLKRKKWARTWAIIAGVVAAMSFPFGTAVCIYTFWMLFSEPGRILFDQNALPNRQAWGIDSWNQQREGQYFPPPAPPDWR
ncbi:MAG TPA: hypothetical protein VJT15_14585 [Pyrinomonadaceae bacterium]|nr:hypothetical protein [Pyrinomonadaceae bacterium]